MMLIFNSARIEKQITDIQEQSDKKRGQVCLDLRSIIRRLQNTDNARTDH